MAIEKLQEKIRKLKNPCIVDFTADVSHIPEFIMQEERDFSHAYGRFCTELLEGLAGKIVGVRFSFGSFALLGTHGLTLLARLLSQAGNLGYYVILDIPEALSSMAATGMASSMFAAENPWECDGILTSAYVGSDGIKPWISGLKESGKDLFVVLRTANRTAPELQDLLTGGRLVYMALADQLNRLGAPLMGRNGYSHVAAVGAASSADCLRNLRSKYPGMFLLIDGADYPNSNIKNCSFAFDKLGHGAVACMGVSVIGAWKNEDSDGEDYVEAACRSVDRIKKNFARYITIL